MSFFLEFLTEPLSQAASTNTDVILDCEARDYPLAREIYYSWRFNGSDTNNTNMFTNNSLLLPLLDETKEGVYQCVVVVTDSPGESKRSREATVIAACK